MNLPEHETADDGEDIGRVVITLKNGEELELWSAIARADSVIGYTINVRREKSIRAHKTDLGPEVPYEEYRTGVPRADIESIKTKKVSVGKTLGITAVIVVGVLILMVAMIGVDVSYDLSGVPLRYP